MNKFLTVLAGAACLLCSTVAQATVYKLDFTASGFSPGIFSNLPAPQNPVTGSITFTASALGAAVTSIEAVDLFIGGHAYTPIEIGTNFYGDGYTFGAKINGVGINRAGNDDFYLILSSSLNVFSYAEDGVFDTWVTRGVTARYTQLAAVVPEPGSMSILAAGFAGLALLRRRRTR